MNSRQIFMIIAMVAALGTVMSVTPVMAQNMTGGNMTGGNMTGKISSFMPPNTSGCPADAEGIERCPPPQEQTDSNEESNENGNGDGDDSVDGNGGDSSNGNENDDNQ
jgi:hypothetical protein